MSGALEASVTLDDVFAVVNAKRVPLAAELAGYLALEIAEGADASSGDVDLRSVFISEEGSVALVRARRDGDAELSIRSVLGRLLEASGSQTPALAGVAKKRQSGGLAGLVEELEAALIPVNRAAGRRALARLAREVKRVTLGVGRNASAPVSERPRALSSRPAPAPLPSPKAKAEVPPASVPGANLPPPKAPPLPASRNPPAPKNPEPTPIAAPVVAAPAPIPVLAPPPSPKEPTPATATNEPPLSGKFEPAAPPPPAAPTLLERAPLSEEVEPPPPSGFHPISVNDPLDDLIAAPLSERPAPLAPAIEELRAVPSKHAESEPPKATERDAVDSLLENFEVSSKKEDLVVARELKAMVGLDPTPPPPKDAILRSPTPAPSSADNSAASIIVTKESPPAPAAKASTKTRPYAPSEMRAPAASTSTEITRPRGGRLDRVLLFLALLMAIGLAVAIWTLKPGFFTGRTPEKIAQEAASVAAAQSAQVAQQRAARCHVTLEVDDVPNNAEVLLREGQAPGDVERMPVGTRLEFVATAEGYAPKRAIIPANAPWDKGADGKPRFEVAVQLDPSRAKTGAVDPWPQGEPGSEVEAKAAAPGTVHLVSTPRGAEIWLTVGVGPAPAQIEKLRCDADYDLLVAGPTSFRKRLHVSTADISARPEDPKDGARSVKLSAK